jgi:hypothetical protein
MFHFGYIDDVLSLEGNVLVASLLGQVAGKHHENRRSRAESANVVLGIAPTIEMEHPSLFPRSWGLICTTLQNFDVV